MSWRFGCICGISGEWRAKAHEAISEGIAHEDRCTEVSWDIVERDADDESTTDKCASGAPKSAVSGSNTTTEGACQ